MTNLKCLLTIVLMMLVLVALAACEAEEPPALPPEERVIETPRTTPVPPQEDAIVYGQALVDGVIVNIPEPEAEEIQVTVSGNLGDPCTEIDDIIQGREGNVFLITITTRRPADVVCAQVLEPFEEVVTLDVDGLEPGTYTVNVNGVQAIFTWPPES
ncbi:MAG TPA: hypothetical protein VF177_11410 [Anaerolineae bacterium]